MHDFGLYDRVHHAEDERLKGTVKDFDGDLIGVTWDPTRWPTGISAWYNADELVREQKETALTERAE